MLLSNKKCGEARKPRRMQISKLIYATMSRNARPGRNFATFLAGICIFLPVAGLTPVRALRFWTTNDPKPVKTTELPVFNVFDTTSINVSNAFLHVDFGSFDDFAILSNNCALFMKLPSTFKAQSLFRL